MKIAIITPGVLPVPPLKGGAVEILIDYIIQYNEDKLTNSIDVYGIFDPTLKDYNFEGYTKTNFIFLNYSFFQRFKRKIFELSHRRFYYNSFLDYFGYVACKNITERKYDVIVVENRQGFVVPLSERIKSKIILHLHNDTFCPEAKDALAIAKRCDAIFTVSNYIKKKVELVKYAKGYVVYNGIDLENFQGSINRSLSRESFGLCNDDFVVVYTGRIEKIKGIKELLEAFLLLSPNKDIKLLVVGGNLDENANDDGFMDEVHRLALSIGKQVVFAGFQMYSNIPEILRLCDIAVIPSICEDALTMVSLEDMAVGLPLIVTRSGGIPEAVDEECAIIVDKEFNLPLKLKDSILQLYNDKDLRIRMSLHAKERAKLFSKDKYAQSFFSALEKVVIASV